MRRRIGCPVFIMFVVVLFIFSTVFLCARLRPVAKELAGVRATLFSETVIHDAISTVLVESSFSYDDIVDISTDASGKVNTVRLDVFAANALRSAFAENIHRSLDAADTTDLAIPIGNLTGLEILSGLGPRIPIKLLSAGYCHIDIKSDFSSAGINQTKHTVYADVSATISVLAPFIHSEAEVHTTVPMAETIIVGNTPNTFADLGAFSK